MSAPQNTITLNQEAKREWLKGPEDKEARKPLKMGVSCVCGFRGKLGELLCDPNNDTVNNFWCPICKGKGWSWD